MSSATAAFGIYPAPSLLAVPLILVWALFCLYLVRAARWTDLALAMVVAGAVQWPLIAFSGSVLLQVSVDVAAAFLIGGAFWRFGPSAPGRVKLLVCFVCVLFAAQAARSPDPQVTASVLRQFLIPLLLLTTGWLLRDDLDWARFARWLALLGLAAGCYMVAEKLLGRPLIGVTPAYLATTPGAESSGLRMGQPFSYYADGITHDPWFRPGGPFFNPPIAGLFLGATVYAAVRWCGRSLSAVSIAVAALACGMAVARAGLLMMVIVAVIPLLLRGLGRVITMVLAFAAGIAAGVVLVEQGNTASHGNAVVNGARYAVEHPLGSGLGSQGFFAQTRAVSGAMVSESWLGVLWASLGLAALVATALVVVAGLAYVWRSGSAAPVVALYPLAVLAVVALSESAGALRGTTPMWLLLGEAVVGLGASLRLGRRSPVEDNSGVVSPA